MQKTTGQGTWLDGVEDGTIHFYNTYGSEDDLFRKERTYISDAGVPREVEDLHPGRDILSSDKEYYCYITDEIDSRYIAKGKINGIVHAKKGHDDQKALINNDVDIEAVLKEIEQARHKYHDEEEDDYGAEEDYDSEEWNTSATIPDGVDYYTANGIETWDYSINVGVNESDIVSACPECYWVYTGQVDICWKCGAHTTSFEEIEAY